MPLKGECNCGAIKVTIADQPPESSGSILCHCLNCRKQGGALGTFIMVIKDEDLTVEGEPKEYLDNKTDSGKELKRWFCGTCGSPIMSTSQLMPGKQFVKMGLFDSIPAPVAEAYTKNRHEWELTYPGTAQLKAGGG